MASASSSSINPASSNGKLAVDDPLSPFFLHHSNSLSLILVSQPFTGDNYASWSRAMQISLSVKDKLGFIDGSIQKLEGNDLNLLQSWT